MTLDEAIEYHINVATRRAVADEGIGANAKWKETNSMTKEESEQIIAHNRQLAEWLKELKALQKENEMLISKCDKLIKKTGELNELKEKAVLGICRREARLRDAKRLLKAAVDDLNFESQCRNCKHKECGLNTVCRGCRSNKYEWRYADEVKKLIKEADGE